MKLKMQKGNVCKEDKYYDKFCAHAVCFKHPSTICKIFLLTQVNDNNMICKFFRNGFSEKTTLKIFISHSLPQRAHRVQGRKVCGTRKYHSAQKLTAKQLFQIICGYHLYGFFLTHHGISLVKRNNISL